MDQSPTGRIVAITRHGHPIASIQPLAATARHERAEALQEMRAQRRGRRLGMSARPAIEEGR